MILQVSTKLVNNKDEPKEEEAKTVFEAVKRRPKNKRKRERNDDPGDSLIAKITPDYVGMDTSEESELKSSTPEKLDNNLSFHCKDLVLGELICDYCSYTNFSKRAMINHLKKKHQWTEPTFVKVAEEDIIEAPIIEIPSAISPAHEKHVTFAKEDTIITDFSLDTDAPVSKDGIPLNK